MFLGHNNIDTPGTPETEPNKQKQTSRTKSELWAEGMVLIYTKKYANIVAATTGTDSAITTEP